MEFEEVEFQSECCWTNLVLDLSEVPQQDLWSNPDEGYKLKEKDFMNMFISTNPKECVNEVNQKFQDPVQRTKTTDININGSKMTDLENKK